MHLDALGGDALGGDVLSGRGCHAGKSNENRHLPVFILSVGRNAGPCAGPAGEARATTADPPRRSRLAAVAATAPGAHRAIPHARRAQQGIGSDT